MPNLAHRVRRAAIVLTVAGAAAYGLVAPAVAEPAARPAAPPAATEEKCTDPLDDAVLCISIISGSDDPSILLAHATLTSEEGRTLKGALVVVEVCSPDCKPSVDPSTSDGVATGHDVRKVATSDQYHPETGTYRANASWVDDQQHIHTGITVDW